MKWCHRRNSNITRTRKHQNNLDIFHYCIDELTNRPCFSVFVFVYLCAKITTTTSAQINVCKNGRSQHCQKIYSIRNESMHLDVNITFQQFAVESLRSANMLSTQNTPHHVLIIQTFQAHHIQCVSSHTCVCVFPVSKYFGISLHIRYSRNSEPWILPKWQYLDLFTQHATKCYSFSFRLSHF